MHKELRYQAKTHAISDMPRKEKKNLPQLLLLLSFFLIKTYYKGE